MRYVRFDAERCVGCQICQLVCSGTWQKVFNPLKANMRIEPTGWYGQFKAHICRQKDDAECVEACPTGALYVDDKKGIVRFERKKCDGCQVCVEACPYGAISIDDDGKISVDLVMCRGCGTCNNVCRSQTIQLLYYRDKAYENMIDALFSATTSSEE